MRRKLTKVDKRAAFLAALARLPWPSPYGVEVAAAAVGVHRATPYRWRERDAAFAEAWAQLEARRLDGWAKRVKVEQAARKARKAKRNAELRAQRQRQAARNFRPWSAEALAELPPPLDAEQLAAFDATLAELAAEADRELAALIASLADSVLPEPLPPVTPSVTPIVTGEH